MAARFGIAAASRGVRPPSSALGSSAHPSGTQHHVLHAGHGRRRRAADRGQARHRGSYARTRAPVPPPRTNARRRRARVARVGRASLAIASRVGGRRPGAAGRARTGRRGQRRHRDRDPARRSCAVRRHATRPRGRDRTDGRSAHDRARRHQAHPRQRRAGLLGLVFSPDGTKLYVHYSGVAAGETVVEEYGFTGGAADPATRRVVLTVPQPQANHNGGQLAFGPDGYLYLGLGDGGSRDDEGPGHAPGGNGQSLATLLGKILRIDPTPSRERGLHDPGRQPVRRRRRAARDLRLRRCATRGGSRSTARPATSGSPTWARTSSRRSPASPPTTRAGANLGWNRYEGTHALPGPRRRPAR